MLSVEVRYKKGSILYTRYGLEHRIINPSFISIRGYVTWWQYGKPHRLDGPATFRNSGEVQYWIRGVRLC